MTEELKRMIEEDDAKRKRQTRLQIAAQIAGHLAAMESRNSTFINVAADALSIADQLMEQNEQWE